jgi:hypothetical protein
VVHAGSVEAHDRIGDFAGHPIERHVLEVLLGVVPAAEHVFKELQGGDRLGASNRASAFEIRPIPERS